MLGRTIIRFLRNERGNFMITFAAAVFGIAGAAGLALDVTRVHNARTEARDAADTAALAAVVHYHRTRNKSGSETHGGDMFDSNYLPEINGAELKARGVTLDASLGQATATASIEVPTTLMALFGHKTMKATVESTAVLNAGSKPFEVGVMLDVSGSMAGAKFQGLKEAVSAMAFELLDPDEAATRIALAPFSSSVNAGSYASRLVGRNSSNNCVGDRLGGSRFSDAPPSGDFFDVNGYYAISDDENGGVYREAHFNGYDVDDGDDDPTNDLDALDVRTVCPGSVIQPLTDDLDQIKASLDGYVAEGITAGHVGMQFAWYLVSEKWRNFWSGSGRPSRDSERQKVVVLMTDGEFNTYFNKSNGLPNDQGRQICAQMKQEGYLVFAISFATQGDSENMLKQCVTKAEYFFDPDTVDGLKQAFLGVALALNTMSKPRLLN